MRKSRFAGARIIGMIKEQEVGMPTADLRRKHGPSPATFYKLKRFWADAMLDHARHEERAV